MALIKDLYFSDVEKTALDSAAIPSHIAIIPDGNRRWAHRQEASVSSGHESGADGVLDIVLSAAELGVKTVTIYTFSTENWRRDPDEIAALMWLIQTYLIEQKNLMIEKGVRFSTIGDLGPLPDTVKETIAETAAATANSTRVNMVLAVNYGSRNEITRAVVRLVDDIAASKVERGDISETLIARYLDTAPFPDPELYIRTSGEHRVSNFLLWQISYAELYMTDVLWPDFRPHHLLEAILCFQKRIRRQGK